MENDTEIEFMMVLQKLRDLQAVRSVRIHLFRSMLCMNIIMSTRMCNPQVLESF